MLYKQFLLNITNLVGKKSINSIALAVSGGSDSIALLMLVHKWADANAISLAIMSVDHHLRKASKQENEYIRELSYKLGHKHYQLHFDHQDKFTNLQARAREGRYQLMTDLCAKLDILTMVTAHHLDDYIENYYLRLARKSSVFGLSSSNISYFNNIRIIRPLYNIPKQQLIEYLLVNNIKWFEDESNLSNKYQRNIIRKNLTKEGADNKNQIISKISEINQQIAKKLQPEFVACIAESVKIYQFGFATIDLLTLLKFSNEIKLQLISYILLIISGRSRTSRSEAINIILELSNKAVKFTKTLHGCIIKKNNSNLIIYREFGRNIPVSIGLNNLELWDNRFLFNLNDPNYYISNFTIKDYSKIKQYLDLNSLKELSFNNHLAILFTMPVVKILEKLIAIPHISYYDDHDLSERLSVTFSPNFISRFTHFC